MAATEYRDWSNERLVARVTELEAKLRELNKQSIKPSQESSPATVKEAKPRRQFDPSRYTTRFIALKIAYLGQKYNGFEWHAKNKTPLPTVEEELWKALVKTKLIFKSETEDINWDDCNYSKAGRTDKGVSAFGQVVGIRVRSSRPRSRQDDSVDGEDDAKPWDPVQDELPYPRLLNRVLPEDIRVLAWCPELPDDFSARFSCRLRKYRYFFTHPAACPLPAYLDNMAKPGSVAPRESWLDLDAMRAAACKFEGTHDFRNFAKHDPARQITNYERHIERAEIEEVPDSALGLVFPHTPEFSQETNQGQQPRVYSFNVWGSAFLWHQVRHMVAIVFLVGQGLETPDLVDKLLDVKAMPRKPVYDMADDQPLVLWDCIFPDLDSDDKSDALRWVLPDDQIEPKATFGWGDGRHGLNGINEVLWSGWRGKKMDEILAGQLLDQVALQRTGASSAVPAALPKNPQRRPGTRLFDGGNTLLNKGEYVPVLRRQCVEAPDVTNARWLEREQAKTAASPVPAASASLNADE